MSEQTRFEPGVGRKGRTFVVMTAIQLPPEGDLVWQETGRYDDSKDAERAMQGIILERMGAWGVMTPTEAGERGRDYRGPPVMVIERMERIVSYAGFVQTPEVAA